MLLWAGISCLPIISFLLLFERKANLLTSVHQFVHDLNMYRCEVWQKLNRVINWNYFSIQNILKLKSECFFQNVECLRKRCKWIDIQISQFASRLEFVHLFFWKLNDCYCKSKRYGNIFPENSFHLTHFWNRQKYLIH